MLKSKMTYLTSTRKVKQPPEGLFCNYTHRICMQNRLDGYDYCIKHVLEDKNAPYKQCNYMSNKMGKRCPNAAPKSDKKDGFCIDHARKAAALRQRASRKRMQKETPETILEELETYNKTAEVGAEFPVLTHTTTRKSQRNNDSTASRILDGPSSDDSDTEPTLVDQAWRGDGESDAESVDSEQEDTQRHADVYTAEEVALITRDKLIRLQSLYIDQFKRLQHVLRERRKKYLHAVKQERETLGSVHSAKNDPTQRTKYKKLMAMKKYHRRFGQEALLHRQSKERRISASEGQTYTPPSFPKCSFANGTAPRCEERVMPLSKYCQDHILEDQRQVLFQPCCFGKGICGKPVPLTKPTPETRCPLHPPAGEIIPRLPDKEESHSDSHGMLDVGNEELHIMDTSDDQPLATLAQALQQDKIMGSGLLEAEESMSLQAAGVPSLLQPPIDTGLHSVSDMDLT